MTALNWWCLGFLTGLFAGAGIVITTMYLP